MENVNGNEKIEDNNSKDLDNYDTLNFEIYNKSFKFINEESDFVNNPKEEKDIEELQKKYGDWRFELPGLKMSSLNKIPI